MSDVAVKVENLSKMYRIGVKEKRHDTIFGAMTAWIKSPVTNFRRLHGISSFNGNGGDEDTIWALNEISLDVHKGEVVGIIGRNGAGKSTLLKVLSRITEPTSGRAVINGRIASLLEVGTGFHPELTGRENIYLNGTILGMTKKELDKRFDEIVDFAEVEKFIDTPVKHYSSGMYVRLAFAVAAHLEPEILLVDEVLAVGDIAFQKKCLGKMGEVANQGRTVLFVSHQMNQIRRLCAKCVWFDRGYVQKFSDTAEAVSAYEAAFSSKPPNETDESSDNHASARFIKWEIVEPSDEKPNVLTTTGPVKVRFTVKVNKPVENGRHGVALYNSDSQLMWGTAFNQIRLNPGMGQLEYILPVLPVRPGVYYWYVSLYDDDGIADLWTGVPELAVATQPAGHSLDAWQGLLNLECSFNVRQIDEDRNLGL